MKALEVLRVIDPLAASQWGLFTTHQASSRGVSKLDLSRLAKRGQIERLAQGIYKVAGAPTDQLEDLRVAWLSTAPSRVAEERIRQPVSDAVVSGHTATWLHEIGDLTPEPFLFSVPSRRQTQRPEIEYWVRNLDTSDVTILNGLPVVTVDRALADLVATHTDYSLVADAYSDAIRTGTVNDENLAKLLAPSSARTRRKNSDGELLLKQIKTIANLDEESIANEIARSSIAPSILRIFQDPHFREAISGQPDPGLARLGEIIRTIQQADLDQYRPIIASLQSALASIDQVSDEQD